MWGTDQQSNMNQADVSVNPQDDFMKQRTIKKSGNRQKMMSFPVENTNFGRLIGSKIQVFYNAQENLCWSLL